MTDRPRISVDFNDDEVGGIVPVSVGEIEALQAVGWSIQTGLEVIAFMEDEIEADGVLIWSDDWGRWICKYDADNVRDISPGQGPDKGNRDG